MDQCSETALRLAFLPPFAYDHIIDVSDPGKVSLRSPERPEVPETGPFNS